MSGGWAMSTDAVESPPRLLTTPEAAEALPISERTL